MPTITADGTMAETLSQAKPFTEIRDSQGRFLGMFTPGTPEEIKLYLHAWLTTDPAEIKRLAEKKGRTRTTAEVLEYLKSLEST